MGRSREIRLPGAARRSYHLGPKHPSDNDENGAAYSYEFARKVRFGEDQQARRAGALAVAYQNVFLPAVADPPAMGEVGQCLVDRLADAPTS